jgi:hypothetical protein
LPVCVFTSAATQAEPPKNAKGKVDEDALPAAKVREMNDKALQLMTTTIACMRPVLWSYLLEFLVPRPHTEALPVLCRCLANLAGPLRETDDDLYAKLIFFSFFLRVFFVCLLLRAADPRTPLAPAGQVRH